jgi:hypothetical protein
LVFLLVFGQSGGLCDVYVWLVLFDKQGRFV